LCYVLKAGWTQQTTYQFFAAVMAFAGVATFLLDRSYHARSTELDADMVEGRTRPA
jgi:uncharacterized protein YbcV (DUF1398 family)